MFENRIGAAEEFVRHMRWDAAQDGQDRSSAWPWLQRIASLIIQGSLEQINRGIRLHQRRWAVPQTPRNESWQEARNQPSTAHSDNSTAAMAILDRPSHFVCICIRHISRTKYLHHVEVDRNPQRIHSDSKDTTDHDMFEAIQKCYYSIRPWWKRLLICARLSSVQYYEVCLSYAPYCSPLLLYSPDSFSHLSRAV